MIMIAKIRDMNVKKSIDKKDLQKILSKEDKIFYKESPFKSVIENIRGKIFMLGSKI